MAGKHTMLIAAANLKYHLPDSLKNMQHIQASTVCGTTCLVDQSGYIRWIQPSGEYASILLILPCLYF